MTGSTVIKTQAAMRNSNIELGRLFCCFCVVLLHVFWMDHNHKVASFVWTMTRCAEVPVFFLIMGFFFSSDKPFKEYMSRLLCRVIIPTIVVMLIFAQLSPWLTAQSTLSQSLGGINREALVNVGKMWLSFDQDVAILPGYKPFLHIWFVFSMITCFLFFPVLRLICADNEMAKAVKKYLLWAGFFYFVFHHTLYVFFPDNTIIKMLTKWHPRDDAYWLWWILLGHQLAVCFKNPQTVERLRPIMLSLGFFTYVLCGVILFWLTVNFAVAKNGQWARSFFQPTFIFYVLPQIGIFIFFIAVKIKSQVASSIILFLADKTFYIYLVHYPIFFAVLKHFNLNRFSFLTFCLVFLLSLFIACILKKAERLLGSAWVRCAGFVTPVFYTGRERL